MTILEQLFGLLIIKIGPFVIPGLLIYSWMLNHGYITPTSQKSQKKSGKSKDSTSSRDSNDSFVEDQEDE